MSGFVDALHIIPVVRTLQHVWPQCQLTWIARHGAAELLKGIDDLEVIVLDAASFRAVRPLRKALGGRAFDVLLNMQTGLAANFLAVQITAAIKLGFGSQRSQAGQTLLCSHQIGNDYRVHPVDTAFQFLEALGIKQRKLVWDLPTGSIADLGLPPKRPILLLSPCVDRCQRPGRSWSAENYASLCDFALQAYNMKAVVVGDACAEETLMAQHIQRFSRAAVVNLCGRLETKVLINLIRHARVVVGSGSKALHLATACGRPAVGLFVHGNPVVDGPYLSHDFCVNKYPDAVMQTSGKTVDDVEWGHIVEDDEVMDLIGLEDVIGKLSLVMDLE